MVFVKKIVAFLITTIIIMIGFPWITVTFAGVDGMAVALLLFFIVNPVFSAVCGVFAGKNMKRLWILPIIVAVFFLSGVWLFFEMGETAFLLYAGIYLIIGFAAMLISYLLRKRRQRVASQDSCP